MKRNIFSEYVFRGKGCVLEKERGRKNVERERKKERDNAVDSEPRTTKSESQKIKVRQTRMIYHHFKYVNVHIRVQQKLCTARTPCPVAKSGIRHYKEFIAATGSQLNR